jgi:hypothetical protein
MNKVAPTKKIFRAVPSKEFVLEILHRLKFVGFNDSKMFTSTDLNIEEFEQLLPLIEPYYYPCKAKRFLYGLDLQTQVITVLRHLLRAVGHNLRSYERLVYGVKKTVYQIISYECTTDLSGSYTVDFN